MYLFVNAMATVSGVVFLYGPQTELASVAVLNMDDTGDIAAAAAMAMMIFYTNVGARAVHAVLAQVAGATDPGVAAAMKRRAPAGGPREAT